MIWLLVGLGAAGLLLVGILAVRVFIAARGLGAEIERARSRMDPIRPPEG
ncbi:hypothetical protein [Herbidospora cretacea]|nr:hypothetical protein [Herbidospora cretacea]